MPYDTDEIALRHQIEALKRLGPEGRFRLAAEMSEDARRIAIEGEQRRHPELTEREAHRIVIQRLLGPVLGPHLDP